MAEKEASPIGDQPPCGSVPTDTDPAAAEQSSSPPGEPMATEEVAAVADQSSTPPGEPMVTEEKAEATAAEDQAVSKPSGPPPGPPIGIITKPKIDYIGKNDLEVDITPQPADCIYIAECNNCRFTIKDRAAKCIIDCCSKIRIEVEANLMSGTMELIDCTDLTLTVDPKVSLPTLTAERCEDTHLHYSEPSALGSMYTVRCPKMWLHFQPPYAEEKVLEFEKDKNQYLTKFVDDDFETEMVIREEGGYATTEKDRERFHAPKKDLKEIFESYLRNLFTFRIPSGPISDEEEEEEEDDGRTEEEKIKEAKELIAKFFGSNIKDEEEKKEIFDSEEEFAGKLDRVAEWMKECKHIVMFTGAGISTSSGIPDYRSGMNTVLKTGPGVWELAAHQSDRPEGAAVTPIINALPSPTHMAIVQMQKQGIIEYTVSQNIDGLHRRSGLPPSTLAELHGNTNLETCKECKRQYLRDFETREAKFVFDHTTSRHCADPACGGVLTDSIINFGEPLPQAELKNALHQGEVADLCIVLGSSLRVSPANQVPLSVHKRGHKVVICNLQKISSYTPDDNTMQVFAKCDDFINGLCKRLNLEIPPFTLYRRAKVSTEQGEGSEVKVTVTGLDTDEKDLPYSFIKVAATKYGGESIEAEEEPLVLTLPNSDEPLPPIIVQCRGHYGEPTFQLECPPVGQEQVYKMSYEVLAMKNWVVTKEDAVTKEEPVTKEEVVTCTKEDVTKEE